jgi:hypothetical protein
MSDQNFVSKKDQDDAMLRIIVPRNIKSKEDLLNLLGTGLKFQDIGLNWDALDDVLDDLSWIEETTVWIEHECLPNIEPIQMQKYVETLFDAVRYWNENGGKRLIVSFG